MVAAHVYLNRQANYLAPAIHLPHLTCLKCRGTVKSGFARCYKCERAYPPNAFPDAMGFGIYAQAGQQSGSVMRRYKGEQPVLLHQTIVLALAMMGVRQAMQRFPIDVITFVPSLSDRKGPHPLARIINQAASKTGYRGNVEEALKAGSGMDNPRGYATSNFQTQETVVHGKNILLIDDTWASGGHFLSATGALRQGGAQSVIGLSLARWLKDGNEYRENDIMKTALSKRVNFKNYSFF
ncbi:hypothetical protein D8M27_08445 [Corynebacterium pseudodiphtheriticum]|nr:hypothetical protein HMPREF1292_01234 [Corynebacterium sp. KPL1995]ERS73239.1 hypothetical protein HMPREF1290_01239 [Corynebacterium sp. KPL1989]RUP89024.1 hypothetical protein D8M37_09125 [Corynebacterium pseudodiphtheriticum]RUP94642.1 hypothetical protein D8M27_08445 [Corynebacterium pseudodiphtheriticum]RUP98173.1 hypothetical protein D8M32_09985 [Corynebacterium pseudodiphtheriticum]